MSLLRFVANQESSYPEMPTLTDTRIRSARRLQKGARGMVRPEVPYRDVQLEMTLS